MRIVLLVFVLLAGFNISEAKSLKVYEADHKYFQYTGRIDFTNPKLPRFWTAGVYIQASFKGTRCELLINDEVLWGTSHNYIEVAIDNGKSFKIKLKDKVNVITVAEGLAKGEHTITICKNTEALIGHLVFVGLKCEKLLPPQPKPARKIEFIGNSITSAMAVDLDPIPCDKGQWFDQHRAWFGYGPRTARALNAQWHLTSESGIGLIRNCCDKPFLMPQVFNKISLSKDSMVWDFSKYQPDVVTVCLGQNDGIQDSLKFTGAYVEFIKTLRGYYPQAQIICLTSPMANDALRAVLKNYLTGVVTFVNTAGDKKVDKFFFSRSWNTGCGGHPDMNEQGIIGEELTAFLKKKMNW